MICENLYLKKKWKLARVSSFDRSGRNDDSLYVPAGHKIVFADINGPGIIKHIWMTTAMKKGALEGLVLRMYWDQSEFPSIEVPLGSFFGMGFGRKVELNSSAIVVSPGGGMNSYFPMPFRTAVKLEIENQDQEDHCLYFHIDYQFDCEIDEDACYFHSFWETEISRALRDAGVSPDNYDSNINFHDIIANSDGKENYKILSVEGHGHYVGCFMHVFSFLPSTDNFRCWYGEGDDMIFVDGEPWPPAIHGTGEEDYFNDAWGLHEFQSLYFGCHYIDALRESAGRYSSYRFHILDPVPFRQEIAVTIEHGHGNERGDFRQSLAFYYLDKPRKNAPLPSYDERVLFNDYQIIPRKVVVPKRKGPYDRAFPDGQPR